MMGANGEMRLARELRNFRRAMVFGVIGFTTLANLFILWKAAVLAVWLCFLLAVMVYLFDVAYHGIKPLRRGRK